MSHVRSAASRSWSDADAMACSSRARIIRSAQDRRASRRSKPRSTSAYRVVPPMRITAALAVMLLAISCGGNAGHSPSPAASGGATTSPSAAPSGSPAVASYGLLLTAGTLEMITPAGTVAAHAKVAAPSVDTCGQNTAALLEPPVSASDDKVYYRDGNTNIKFLTPDGKTGDVTTVPGSATTVSFFSVSPDDMRIAVLVEDLTPASTINLSLYVED